FSTPPRAGSGVEVGRERKTAVWLLAVEVSGGTDRVGDRDAEASAFDQHPGGLGNRGLEVGNVLQRHERDGEVRLAAGDRKVVRVAHDDQLAACLVCQAGHGWCGIDRNDPMPTLSK